MIRWLIFIFEVAVGWILMNAVINRVSRVICNIRDGRWGELCWSLITAAIVLFIAAVVFVPELFFLL